MRPSHREVLLGAKAQLCIPPAHSCTSQDPGDTIYHRGSASTWKVHLRGFCWLGAHIRDF